MSLCVQASTVCCEYFTVNYLLLVHCSTWYEKSGQHVASKADIVGGRGYEVILGVRLFVRPSLYFVHSWFLRTFSIIVIVTLSIAYYTNYLSIQLVAPVVWKKSTLALEYSLRCICLLKSGYGWVWYWYCRHTYVYSMCSFLFVTQY